MKLTFLSLIVAIVLCNGCSSLHVVSSPCTHSDQPINVFNDFSDGHHFLYGKNSKLLASVETKSCECLTPLAEWERWSSCELLSRFANPSRLGVKFLRRDFIAGRFRTIFANVDSKVV